MNQPFLDYQSSIPINSATIYWLCTYSRLNKGTQNMINQWTTSKRRTENKSFHVGKVFQYFTLMKNNKEKAMAICFAIFCSDYANTYGESTYRPSSQYQITSNQYLGVQKRACESLVKSIHNNHWKYTQ